MTDYDDTQRAVATDGGRDQDNESFYVVDEDRGAVVAGPFDSKQRAADDARDRTPSHIVVSEVALRMLETASSTRIRWENDDVDVVTDGGSSLPDTFDAFLARAQMGACSRCGDTIRERYLEDGVCVGCKYCLATDGGAAPRWRQAGVDVVQTYAGIGDQNPECENGTPGCPGLNPPSGVLPCGPCFLSGGSADE